MQGQSIVFSVTVAGEKEMDLLSILKTRSGVKIDCHLAQVVLVNRDLMW